MNRFVPLLSSLLALSCVRADTVPVRYVVPDSVDAEEARLCAGACRGEHGADREAFFSCLRACPGVVMERGLACSDAPTSSPGAACYTDRVESEEPANGTARVLGDLVVRAALALVEQALEDRAHHRGERHRAHPGRRRHRD